MEHVVIRTSKPPYGIKVVAKRGRKIQVIMKTIVGSVSYVELPPAVAEHLRDELNTALAAMSAKG